MTPEQLDSLRGLVARGQLGCGPKTTELVRELLAAHDAQPGRLSALARAEIEAARAALRAAARNVDVAASEETPALCSLYARTAAADLATAIHRLSSASAYENAATLAGDP